MARRRPRPAPSCPCGSAAAYDACCGPLHRGERHAATAEQLMRSRYSAFAVGDAEHLLRTWHPSARPAHLVLDDALRWTGLEVTGTTGGSALEAEGTVDFVASALRDGRREQVRERSRFVRDGGRWVYEGPAGRPLR